MPTDYVEPFLNVLVLDFAKPIESRICLESVKQHLKVDHHVIFCDNGSGEDYPIQFLKEGLIDQLIVNRQSRGLGLGTRDVFALSPDKQGLFSLYLQNDQYFIRDLTREELIGQFLTGFMGSYNYQGDNTGVVQSISLAGSPCGPGIYSERAHLIETTFYHNIERAGDLGYHGAGPYHDGTWREAQMQALYKKKGWLHYAYEPQVIADNGVFAVRDMGDGGLWCHRTDSKALWNIVAPTVKNPAYPKINEDEFQLAKSGQWPDGKIPEAELSSSFLCWEKNPLAIHQNEYIEDLRRRARDKK